MIVLEFVHNILTAFDPPFKRVFCERGKYLLRYLHYRLNHNTVIAIYVEKELLLTSVFRLD
jgi:hypothetical protein